MARSDAILRELEQLKAELGRVSAAVGGGASAAAASMGAAGAEAGAAVRAAVEAAAADAGLSDDLHGLEARLEAEIARAEDFAEEHPLLLAGAALVLGIAIGRLWGAR